MACYKIHDLKTFCLTRYGQMLFEDSNIQHIYIVQFWSKFYPNNYSSSAFLVCMQKITWNQKFLLQKYTPVHTYVTYVGTKLSQQVMHLGLVVVAKFFGQRWFRPPKLFWAPTPMELDISLQKLHCRKKASERKPKKSICRHPPYPLKKKLCGLGRFGKMIK